MRIEQTATLLAVVGLAAAAAPAAGREVALAPSTLPGVSVVGDPLFSPDGQMVYVQGRDRFGALPESSDAYPTRVLARDPQTGRLSALPCQSASGGMRCPPDSRSLAISPDGRSLYVLGSPPGQSDASLLQVFARDSDGTLTQVQCFVGLGGENAEPGCAPAYPNALASLAITADGSILYAAGESPELIEFARNPSDGTLTFTDCVAGFPERAAGHPEIACREDPVLKDKSQTDQLVVADHDAYIYDPARGEKPGTFAFGYRPDPQTGRLAQIAATPADRFGELAAAPDGRRIYASWGRGSDLWSIPRDPATGRLGTPACYPARSGLTGDRTTCPGHTTRGTDAYTSLAVSPDGQTVVTAMWSEDLTAGGPAMLPGGGISDEVVTYRLDSTGTPVAAGCVGDSNGCAAPVGRPSWVRYPSSGPGPYLASMRGSSGDLRLLAAAPTLRIGRLLLRGRTMASITCPADRSEGCRGTIAISRVSASSRTGPLTRQQRSSYRLAAGATRSLSLKLTRRSRASFLALTGTHGDALGALIRISDATGLTTPTGVLTCVRPAVPGTQCFLTAAYE